MSMTQSMVHFSHSQLPKEGFCWHGEQLWRFSEKWDVFVTTSGVMGSAKVASEITMGESRPSARWALEQRATCVLDCGNPLDKSLVHHQCAQVCFTSWAAQQRRQVHQDQGGGLKNSLPPPQSLGWPHLWTGGPCSPGPRHHPHWVTASPSQRREQPPVRGWLQGKAYHSQRSPGSVASFPSYQCSRGYSCWELGSLAGGRLRPGYEGRRD